MDYGRAALHALVGVPLGAQPRQAPLALLQQETSAEPGEGYSTHLQPEHHAFHNSAIPSAEGASLSAKVKSEGAISVPPRETVA